MSVFYSARSHEKMKEVLMNPNAIGPSVHYYMIRGGKDKTNISIWETGKVDNEYIKSYGHYHIGNISETYIILQGAGILLLQKRKKDDKGKPTDNEIEIFKAYSVKAGDKIFIEPEMGHLLVNTGNTWLVTSDNSPVYEKDVDPAGLPGHADYEPVKKMGGFACFVVEKDNKPTLVKNKKYKSVPDAVIVSL
jgi:glucose-6-phosphate isomerase, archaeal